MSLFQLSLLLGCIKGLHVGGGQAWGVGRGEEVTEALLGQLPVLVIIEGLSWKLAEEVRTVPETAGAAVSIQGAKGGCQGLCAAAAANTAVGKREKICQVQRPVNKFCGKKKEGVWLIIAL